MEKKKFKIPVRWEMFGEVEVEAETLKEAIKKFHIIEAGEGFPLPEGEYVGDSFQMEDYEIVEENNLLND